MNPNWRWMKRTNFGGAKNPFHAAEIRNPIKKQITSINNFFQNNIFYRLYVAGDLTTQFLKNGEKSPSNCHEAVSGGLIIKIQEIVSKENCTRVFLIFEHSERTENKLQEDFLNTFGNIEYKNKDGKIVKWEPCWMDKKSIEPGLEVADLIMHTVGSQIRNWGKVDQNNKFRKDFVSIFHNSPRKYVYGIHMDKTEINNKHEK